MRKIEKGEVCCSVWEKNVSQDVEVDDSGLHIDGCCGGGCFVISNMIFCPFCGKKLYVPEEKSLSSKKVNIEKRSISDIPW